MTRTQTKIAALSLVVFTGYVFAQSDIVTAGYSIPPPAMYAAPGQVVTLFVRGITAKDAVAQSFPLPTILSGLSVAVKVLCCNPQTYPSALPIFKIHSEDSCDGRGFLPCPLTQVTIQIPTEPLCSPNGFPNSCMIVPGAFSLTVNTSGDQGSSGTTAASTFPVVISGFHAHFLNNCDTVLGGSGICSQLITHADGTPVTSGNFAKPGETIVLYAVGLGFGDPSVPTGTAAKSPAYANPGLSFSMLVSFREDLPPASPAPPLTYLPAGKYFEPDFVGVVPGYAGLYQINFTVPQPPTQAHHCAGGFADTNTRIAFSFSTTNEYVDVCVLIP
jgi:hypothetical protein